MAHGGEFETSLMLFLYSEIVAGKDERDGIPLSDPYHLRKKDLFVSGPLSIYRPFGAYSETGAIGNPELGDAEKGEQLFDHLGDRLAELLRDVYRKVQTGANQ